MQQNNSSKKFFSNIDLISGTAFNTEDPSDNESLGTLLKTCVEETWPYVQPVPFNISEHSRNYMHVSILYSKDGIKWKKLQDRAIYKSGFSNSNSPDILANGATATCRTLKDVLGSGYYTVEGLITILERELNVTIQHTEDFNELIGAYAHTEQAWALDCLINSGEFFSRVIPEDLNLDDFRNIVVLLTETNKSCKRCYPTLTKIVEGNFKERFLNQMLGDYSILVNDFRIIVCSTEEEEIVISANINLDQDPRGLIQCRKIASIASIVDNQ